MIEGTRVLEVVDFLVDKAREQRRAAEEAKAGKSE